MIALVALVALIAGYYFRELKEAIARIELALKVLLTRQKKEEDKPKGMGFGEPLTMQEFQDLEEEARINRINL